jgi:threonine/homoserine/homoserine lactone efflux protein
MLSLQFLLTAFVVVIAPGTGVIYTLAIGLGQGRRAALMAAFGCTVGIVPHLLASQRIMRWMNRSFAAILAALAGRLALERA